MIADVLIAQVQSSAPASANAPVDEVLAVRGRREPTGPGATAIAADTARAMAATQNDALRVVMSMPGVGRPSFEGGQVILWGAPADSSRVYIDGVPIPALYHGGGARGVVQDAFFDSIAVIPGGFGVEYGQATGGVVLLASQTPSDLRHGRLSADVIDASTVASHGDRGLRVSAGLRGGYLGDLLHSVAGEAIAAYIAVPRSLDYQNRADFTTAGGTQWTAFFFGSVDRLELAPPGEDASRARRSERSDSFHRMVFRARTHDGAAPVDATAWLGVDDHARRDAVGPYASEANHDATLAGLRASYAVRLAAWLRVRAGVEAEAGIHRLSRLGSLAVPPREGDPFVLGQIPPDDVRRDAWTVRSVAIAPWIEATIALAAGRLLLTPGMRVDATLIEASRAMPPVGDTLARGTAHVLLAAQPRVAARMNVTPALAIAASYGLYAMPPDPQDLSAVFGNPRLDGPLSHHATLGVVARAFGAWTVSATGFVRHTQSVAVRPAEIPAAGAALVNAGSADSLGVQALLRCAPWHGFNGWIAYTLSRSAVVDPASPGGRLADTDQTHLLSAVAHYVIARGVAVGSRVRVVSGLPRTPVTGHALDVTSGDVQPMFGGVNSDRLPTYVGVDLRVDWQGVLAGKNVSVWLDLLNVTGQASIEDVLYDATYRERRYVTGIPFFADLGARVEF